jgi:excinuclease ABC subunit A
MQNEIIIKGAHLHNLKNITLSIPKNQFVILTGLSGSGKSTLAFETLYKESQRQFMESLGMVSMYVSKPEVDTIIGLSPSISIGQNLSNNSPRSTVGTVTDVFTYLRVLFARLGHRICIQCKSAIPPSSYNISQDSDEESETNKTLPCPHCGTLIPELGMAHFSFNKPAGACPNCTGLGVVHTANLELLLDPKQSILDGGVLRWEATEIERYSQILKAAGKYYGFSFDPSIPIGDLDNIPYDMLLYGALGDRFRRHFPEIDPPEIVSKGRFEGIIPNLMRRYAEHINNIPYREKLGKLLIQQICPDCNGERLCAESRSVTINGQTIIDVSHMSFVELLGWVNLLKNTISLEAWQIAEPIVNDLQERIHHLIDVGIGYLSINRDTPSLSAGEEQRLRLASLLGSTLTGVIYILDEPTIGLHPRDNNLLIKVLHHLRDLGNTILVIEHDLDMIKAADYVIEIGPGAGAMGGQIVATGTPEEIAQESNSITGKYLSRQKSVPMPSTRRPGNKKFLVIKDASMHNLKDITVEIPLGMLIAVAGVSGSGKSSLILDTLGRVANQRYHQAKDIPGKHHSITGWEHIDNVISIDQQAIGRTPRSNAATYTDIFTPIRQTFANLPEAQHLKASHFSFNVPGGRCDRCEGAGVLTINMHFLPDGEVCCPDCHGRRFQPEVLNIKYRGVDIAEVLDLTIEESLQLFNDIPSISNKLSFLKNVGLGYLKLGQPATMISGGEAQRIKLAKELGRRSIGHTLYLLDEPSTGLHSDDITRLLVVLQQLVDAGNTVLIIEHNLEIIRAADWLIELGPEGGEAGGHLITQGTPEHIAEMEYSPTGKFLQTLQPLP